MGLYHRLLAVLAIVFLSVPILQQQSFGEINDLVNIKPIITLLETPWTKPKQFTPIRHSPAKLHIENGTVWEKDTSAHGGEQYKMWPDIKSWKQRGEHSSVWNNGTVRKEPHK